MLGLWSKCVVFSIVSNEKQARRRSKNLPRVILAGITVIYGGEDAYQMAHSDFVPPVAKISFEHDSPDTHRVDVAAR